VLELKKKHSKTGEESRFQGTVLGKGAEPKSVKIDGGPETIADWFDSMRQQQKSNDSIMSSETLSSDDTLQAD
jgi:transcription initiation factor TFIID subunit 3